MSLPASRSVLLLLLLAVSSCWSMKLFGLDEEQDDWDPLLNIPAVEKPKICSCHCLYRLWNRECPQADYFPERFFIRIPPRSIHLYDCRDLHKLYLHHCNHRASDGTRVKHSKHFSVEFYP